MKKHHNPDIERAIIGSALSNSKTIIDIHTEGGRKLFTEPLHIDLWETLYHQFSQDAATDPISIIQVMTDTNKMVAGQDEKYIAETASLAATEKLIPAYLKLLRELYNKRLLKQATQRALDVLSNDNESLSETLGRLQVSLMQLGQERADTKPVHISVAIAKAFEQIEKAMQSKIMAGVPAYIDALNDLIGTFRPGEMTLLAGRPSMGKSAIALCIALRAARNGHPVVFASLEMPTEAMATRALSEYTSLENPTDGIPYSHMWKGAIDDDGHARIKIAAEQLKELPITFLPHDYVDINFLHGGIKHILMSYDKTPLVIIDYAQLMRSNLANRYEQITEISMTLKNILVKNNFPMILVSQLSRAVERRDQKRPVLSDLRESGQLEQDADIVIFCYRDEYYLRNEEPDPRKIDAHQIWEDAMFAAANKLELIVAKNRNGPVGTAHAKFNPALSTVW